MKNYWLNKAQKETEQEFYDHVLADLSFDGEKELLKHLLNKYKNDEEVLNAINMLITTIEVKSNISGSTNYVQPDFIVISSDNSITISESYVCGVDAAGASDSVLVLNECNCPECTIAMAFHAGDIV